MIQPLAFLPLLLCAAIPADYQAGIDEAKTRGVPLYVLVTGDNCEACHKVLAAGVPRALARRGVVRIVNASKLPKLAAHLLGKDRRIPRLIRFRWIRNAWRTNEYLGVDEIAAAANEPTQPESGEQATGLMVVAVPVVSQVSAGRSPLLTDLMQRNRRDTGYSEPGGQAHYCTHFINSNLRTRYGYQVGVYMGGGKGYLLNAPKTTLREVAAAVPGSLRGIGYKTYVIDSQQWWNDNPLYPMDEWAAYLTSAQARADYGGKDSGGSAAFDFRHAVEMMIYSFVACQCAERGDQTNLPAAKQLVRIMVEKTLQIAPKVCDVDRNDYHRWMHSYARALMDAPDAEGLRQYVREVWGAEWTKDNLGF